MTKTRINTTAKIIEILKSQKKVSYVKKSISIHKVQYMYVGVDILYIKNVGQVLSMGPLG